MSRHIDDKLELLRELIKTEWRDCRTKALLESIRKEGRRLRSTPYLFWGARSFKPV